MNHPTHFIDPPRGVLRWHAGGWWWADPDRARIVALHDGGRRLARTMPDRIHAIASCVSGRLLLGAGKRLCLATDGRLTRPRVLVTVDAADPRTTIGAGRTDAAGAFVFGTSNTGADGRPIGSFFQFSHRHGLRRLALPTVTRAAAICFGSGGARLYLADAEGAALLRCRYDANLAAVADVHPFAAALPGLRIADAIVDGADGIWTVQGAPGLADRLVHYGPDGALHASYNAGPLGGLAFGGDRHGLMTMAQDGTLRALPQAMARGRIDVPFDDAGFDGKGQPDLQPPGP